MRVWATQPHTHIAWLKEISKLASGPKYTARFCVFILKNREGDRERSKNVSIYVANFSISIFFLSQIQSFTKFSFRTKTTI